jgi:hypothetical protein
MKGKIVILGNGFDLAHGLKTSYSHFIEYLINESIKYNSEIREELIDLGHLFSEDSNFETIKKKFHHLSSASKSPVNGKIFFPNNFFKALLGVFFDANWVDIEDYYFRYMKNTKNIEELNSDFEIIKKHLEKYLVSQQIKKDDDSLFIKDYVDIFKEGKPDSILFLNFNYTSTINLYLKSLSDIQDVRVINIHGELETSNNPIIFGYGDDNHPDYISYIKNTNDSYLRNLKRQQYNLASSYKSLKTYLDSFIPSLKHNENNIEVYCIGHSLSLSDKTLLNEIFENESVNKIKLYYYKDIEGYRSLNNNIARISSSTTLNNKVVNFPESIKTPQI